MGPVREDEDLPGQARLDNAVGSRCGQGWWVPGPDVWEIDWERVEGGPAKSDVLAAIQARPAVARYLGDMQLHSAAGPRGPAGGPGLPGRRRVPRGPSA
jgi:hypothetical protein